MAKAFYRINRPGKTHVSIKTLDHIGFILEVFRSTLMCEESFRENKHEKKLYHVLKYLTVDSGWP